MFEKLLERISKGDGFSIHSLALEFDTSDAMIELMLEDLVRRGYLRSIEHCADTACSGCGAAGSCKLHGKMWTQGEKEIKK
ncbi:MAG TPA: FeoC-like transcriptional regulator [Longilinea sp.]|nr:FeoC-like transcriptional regulator [Longilinea sp.]